MRSNPDMTEYRKNLSQNGETGKLYKKINHTI